jgi:magnesium transporter
VHAIIDSIVDNYFILLEKLEEKIEFLEDDLLKKPTPVMLQAIHELKRELILLRKSLWPLREAISALERSDSPLISESTGIYFKDIFDHVIAVIDSVETFRDMLSGMLDIYLSSVSNRLNQVMKVLTIIATIFMPLTFLAGVYGMNFQYMPELTWRWGYFGVLGIMLVIALSMLYYFRKKKWF